MSYIGKSYIREDALLKVTGKAEYLADREELGTCHVKMVVSPYAHARIQNIDTREARKVDGVLAVVTGEQAHTLTGEEMADRPILAYRKVRYFGEPVALVVAQSVYAAKRAASLIKVICQPLPVVNSPSQAIQKNAPLVHEHMESYRKLVDTIRPVPGTNIAHHQRIRKGNPETNGAADVFIQSKISFPQADHAAMETRVAACEIKPNGVVVIESATQSPFVIKSLFRIFFNLRENQVIVHTPLVGGAFGGKSMVQLEYLVYIASKAVNGRRVKLVNTREEDIQTSPVHIGLDAKVTLGAAKDGRLKYAEILFLFDGGAYSDKAVDIVRAAANDCTGPYNIENVKCDSFCMYTNHPYATSFRGFGHPELTFAIERAMDKLAVQLHMDPLSLRMINAIRPGDFTPTQVQLTASMSGNLPKCLNRLKEIIQWEQGNYMKISENKVRAKGCSCFWKTSNIDVDATAGAVILFNGDGTVNLHVGVVEIGTGTRSVLRQLLAQKLDIPPDSIYVEMEFDTGVTPNYWKTVASRGMQMVGNAVVLAAEDAINQLKETASAVLRMDPSQLAISDGKVFAKEDPKINVDYKEICNGYTFPNGNSIGGQVIGRGDFIINRMTHLDPDTGSGRPGPDWTVGAEAVEVELDLTDFHYRLLNAVAVIDVGKVINPKLAEGQVMGAMNMGLSFASREPFVFTKQGRILNDQLRNYNITRFGEQPRYYVEFVETLSFFAPYGLRGVGEHGLNGMPAALGSALSTAAGVELNQLPLTPEYIWKRQVDPHHTL